MTDKGRHAHPDARLPRAVVPGRDARPQAAAPGEQSAARPVRRLECSEADEPATTGRDDAIATRQGSPRR